MGASKRTVLARAGAIVAGVAMAAPLMMGTAFAADPLPIPNVPGVPGVPGIPGITGDTSGLPFSVPADLPAIPGVPSVDIPELPPISVPSAGVPDLGTYVPPGLAVPAIPGVSDPPTSSSSPNNSTICNQLASQLTGLLGQIASLSSLAGSTPAGPILDALLGQIAGLQAQANDLAQQLATLACSFLPGGGSGGGSATSAPEYTHPVRDYHKYGYGHHYYASDYYRPVGAIEATQVETVPSGGVDTGDGSTGP